MRLKIICKFQVAIANEQSEKTEFLPTRISKEYQACCHIFIGH